MAFVFLLVNLYRLSSAVLADQLTIAFDTTATQLGTLHASFFWIYAVLQIPAGVLADRFGPRRTVTGGGILMNVGVVGFALSETYALALLARTLIGLGGGMIFISILRFCANWYRPNEFATMSGLTFAVAGLGGIMATTPLAVVVDAVGWRTTLLGLGGFGFGTAAATYVVTRDTPERAGLGPIEGVPEQPKLSLPDVVRGGRRVLREPTTWVLSLALFCTTGVNMTVFGLWGIPYVAQLYDTSVTVASWFTLLGSAGLLVGPPTIGWLSDHLEQRTGLMVAGGICYAGALAVFPLVGRPPLAVVAVLFFAVGCSIGAIMLGYPVIKERHESGVSGVATGVINSAAFFGAAILPTAMGFALDVFWTGETVAGAPVYTGLGYRIAFGIAAVAGLVACLCMLWIHRRVD